VTERVLAVDRLSVTLPRGADRLRAVTDVSFDMSRGELLCLVGESGSGKSIAAHAVMGLLPANVRVTGGRVQFRGEELLDASPARRRQLRGEQMSMIFQEPMTALNPVMSCGTQIDELLQQHSSVSAAARRARVLEMLERVRLPDVERIFMAYPHQLSGGQRQRIMIAMATILRPALLIADEPTTALDVVTQGEILRLIRELQREHDTAVLFITHDFGVVAEIADSIAVLQSGAVVESGSAQRVLASPSHSYTRMLLESVPGFTPRKAAMDADSVVLLRTNGLTKVFESGGWFWRHRRVVAANRVDMEVRRGETLGIVGESGSGKSTVARLTAKLLAASSGTIHLGNDDVTHAGAGATREFRRKVQVVFQDPYRSLNPRRTAGAAITEGLLNFGATRSQARTRAGELMEMVKLSPSALTRYPHEFSGGQRQRICIARALAVGPELLIADEAVSALDVSVQAQMLTLFEELRQRFQLTLIFITHDLRVAAQICNSVMVIKEGRVVEYGPTMRVFQNPQHDYTRTMLESAPGRGFVYGARAGHA
jgi:peptide/nickel transport system ATP-binding protein